MSEKLQQPGVPLERGKVYLVGAGPGAPDLITVKGLRCLRAADVVIYDRLVAPELLAEVRAGAELIFAGKRPGCHQLPQAEINRLLIEQARRGRLVVRLKGGDPFVFGRGGEEAEALAQAGIPFEVVPGVSAALAVPAYAGVPVTHRGLASLVTIVTGHKERGAEASAVDWRTLARVGGTLVILMGVKTLPQIVAELQAGGLNAETPALVVEWGTLPQQRSVEGRLAEIAERAAQAGIRAPAVIVVGEVVRLREVLAWFQDEGTAPLAADDPYAIMADE
ncbi:MAG: uroporphyrinogen-III C-methyltransferase [Thermogemmatispora sp.]|uniref:uroporphyrinogen-III C-methyltransferase n=1 Tax=Thermogemmatispora sp. TaxID=1968838 RepID=UPI00260E1699|nr:uroporphyrinogen-III C-methyltransferase [Thermogemmatispora sp.]MBX5458923.1 uroporphyrinogen-III C-methyltransferase [Thermogemmatispora sp.]